MENLDLQNDSDKSNATQKSKAFAKSLIEQLELIVIVFSVIILVFSFVGRTCRVSGPSMENTLLNNQTVVTSDLFYTPKRNDIVVFHQTGTHYNEPIVKRVIGVPGDTVNIEYFSDTMRVTVIDANGNQEVLNEDYIKYEGVILYSNSSTYVEEGTVFVMGDNRNNSADSRSRNIGLVDTRKILGKVIFRITPISEFGIVK